MTERCACCGQVIPPRSLFEQIQYRTPAGISRRQPVKQAIYEYVAAHPEGVTRDQLMTAVYADRIDGGPEFPNVICVHIKRMRPILEAHGLTITSARGPGSTYRLERLSQ